MTDKPHNNFFEYVFSQNPVVQDFVTYLVSDLAEKVDVKTLTLDNTSYIDEQLQGFYSDIVYNVETNGGKTIKLAFLFEHKSTQPIFPHVQLAEYRQGIWRRDVASFLKKKEKGEPRRTSRKLTRVIPIIFYHGKKKWNKKPMSAYFDEVDEVFEPFFPTFDYYLVDLSDYDDEFILKLKSGFLINSLLAFKHKGDGDYVRKHFTRIFVNLEENINEQTKLFLRHLSVYIVITTKLTDKDVNELVEQLPIETKQEFMTAYDNILEKGKEIGLEIGSKRGEDKKSIEFAIKLLKENLPDSLVLNLSDTSKDVLAILKKAIADDFKTKILQKELVKALMEHYEYLRDEDIQRFSKLELEEIRSMRVELNKTEKR
jgi:predicted transposase YdaD